MKRCVNHTCTGLKKDILIVTDSNNWTFIVFRVLGYDEIWDEDKKAVRKISIGEENFEGGTGGTPTIGNDIDIIQLASSEQKETNCIEKKIHGGSRPLDFDGVVNAGIKSEVDGMYYWQQDRDNSAFLGIGYGLDDDELVSSSSQSSDNIFERERVSIADLDKPGSYVVVAVGE